MTLRIQPVVGAKVGPIYVGARITPGRSPYGQSVTPQHTPRQTPRQTPAMSRKEQERIARVARAAQARAQHQATQRANNDATRFGYSLPVYQGQQAVTFAPTTYSTQPRRTAGHYLCMALAMVLIAFLGLVALAMAPFVTLPLVAVVVMVKIIAPRRRAAATQHSDNKRSTGGPATRR